MLVLHFSLTPLSASPIRICRALNLHEGIEARFVQLNEEGYGRHSFETDLVWSRDRRQVIELLKRADIVHLHNYLNLNSTEFDPISFRRLWDEGRPMVRQFHSTSALIARIANCSVEEVLACPIPKLVISQYPERFYPNAKVVPNIVFGAEAAPEQREGKIRVGYSPSNFRSGRASRWDTKGYPETIKMLRSLKRTARRRGLECEIDVIEKVTHEECLKRKAHCHISIDDLTTGSFHMSTLESMLAGSVSLSYLDERVLANALEMSGTNTFPCLSVRLEEAASVVLSLLEQPEAVFRLGQDSATWMREHWNPYDLASRFLDIYKEVISSPGVPFQNRFDLTDPGEAWRIVSFPDAIWAGRHQHWPKLPPKSYTQFRGFVGRALRAVGVLGR